MENVKKNKTIKDTNQFQSGLCFGLKISFLLEELIGLKKEGERLIPTDFIPLLDPVYKERRPTDQGATEGARQTEQAGPSKPVEKTLVPASALVRVPTEGRPTPTEGPKGFLKRKSDYFLTASEEERKKKRKKRQAAVVGQVIKRITQGKAIATEEPPKKKKGELFYPSKIVAKKLQFFKLAEEPRPSVVHPLLLAGSELLPVEAFNKIREDFALQQDKFLAFEDIRLTNSEEVRSDAATQLEE